MDLRRAPSHVVGRRRQTATVFAARGRRVACAAVFEPVPIGACCRTACRRDQSSPSRCAGAGRSALRRLRMPAARTTAAFSLKSLTDAHRPIGPPPRMELEVARRGGAPICTSGSRCTNHATGTEGLNVLRDGRPRHTSILMLCAERLQTRSTTASIETRDSARITATHSREVRELFRRTHSTAAVPRRTKPRAVAPASPGALGLVCVSPLAYAVHHRAQRAE